MSSPNMLLIFDRKKLKYLKNPSIPRFRITETTSTAFAAPCLPFVLFEWIRSAQI